MIAMDMDKPRRAALCVSILGLLLHAAPTNPGMIATEAKFTEELAPFAEVADWLEPREGVDLSDAVRERRESFDLFLSQHDDELLSERVVGLPFGPAIRETADRHSLDALLLASIIEVESGFDPQAVSHRGATGLMQVMPSTAGDAVDLRDPERNLEAGARYLTRLLDRYDGDLALTLAAYNAGPDSVRRYGGVPPFRETRHYVDRVLEIYVDHHRHIWTDAAAEVL